MAQTLQPGTVLQGTYEVREQIGAGGGGTIYRGYHTHLKTEIAIKKIHDKGKYDENEVFREASILTKLRHSYLPRVYDFLILDSGVYTVMDFIPGQSIEQMLKKGYVFTEKEVVKYGTQLSEVLSYLHGQKPAIIHGDIKPANIMITPENNVCLIDFNISGMADEKGNAYVMGYSAGYAAPEQFKEYKEIVEKLNKATEEWQRSLNSAVTMPPQGSEETVLLDNYDPDATLTMMPEMGDVASSKPTMASLGIKGIHIDPSSDVYSVGATLYHMVTGHKITENQDIKSLSVSNGLIIVINKAINENRNKRYKNAFELLDALRGVYKLDKRYKKVRVRQQLVQSFFVILTGLGIIAFVYGRRINEDYDLSQYRTYVDTITECSKSGDIEGAMEAYNSAVELHSDEIEAYSAMAEALYNVGEYEAGINYIESDVLSHSYLTSSSAIDYVYYILGRDYFELNDYRNAALNFEKAISVSADVSDYYVFDALSLARLGLTAEAQTSLDNAITKGASEEYVLLLKGELSKAEGNLDEARDCFENCINVATDSYIKSRAFIFYSDVYQDMDVSEENFNAQIGILKKALTSLSQEYKALVLSRLSQAYMNLYSLNGDVNTANDAIDTYNQILKLGIVDFSVYNNMVVLYEQTGQYEAAVELLNSIENAYSNYYGFYKRLAFLEFRIQNDTPADSIDYSKFEEYYAKATELYSKLSEQNDMEMLYLEQTYENYMSIINVR